MPAIGLLISVLHAVRRAGPREEFEGRRGGEEKGTTLPRSFLSSASSMVNRETGGIRKKRREKKNEGRPSAFGVLVVQHRGDHCPTSDSSGGGGKKGRRGEGGKIASYFLLLTKWRYGRKDVKKGGGGGKGQYVSKKKESQRHALQPVSVIDDKGAEKEKRKGESSSRLPRCRESMGKMKKRKKKRGTSREPADRPVTTTASGERKKSGREKREGKVPRVASATIFTHAGIEDSRKKRGEGGGGGRGLPPLYSSPCYLQGMNVRDRNRKGKRTRDRFSLSSASPRQSCVRGGEGRERK